MILPPHVGPAEVFDFDSRAPSRPRRRAAVARLPQQWGEGSPVPRCAFRDESGQVHILTSNRIVASRPLEVGDVGAIEWTAAAGWVFTLDPMGAQAPGDVACRTCGREWNVADDWVRDAKVDLRSASPCHGPFDPDRPL